MDLSAFRGLLDDQAGVVSRRELLEGGATDNDIRRWVRRRELRRVHSGVYVNHTGPLTWANRAWAAVLFYWPAALAHASAVNRAGDVIHVAIDEPLSPVRLPGTRVHRLVRFEERVQWNASPPRVRLEDALLSMAGEAGTRADALALVSDACRRRTTTPWRLAQELRERPRVRNRAWLLAVLEEAGSGVQSLLESAYRRRVERAHGLPTPERQARERTVDGVVYRDIRYRRFGVVVELDGRVGHELSRDRWNDQDRDLVAATGRTLTVRLGWRHADVTPCRTAARMAVVLQSRGWTGSPHPCGTGCKLDLRAIPGTR